MNEITLPTIGALEDDVSMDVVTGESVYTLSLMFNPRVGRWFYSVAGVQDNLAVGAPCELPDKGMLLWSESPESRDLSTARLFLLR